MRAVLIPVTICAAVASGVLCTIRPDLGRAAIGLCLLGLLSLAGTRVLTQATIFVAATTLPAAVPNAVPVGTLAVNLYEPLLLVLVVRLVLGSRQLPHRTRSGLTLLGMMVVVGAVLGFLQGAQARWIIFDVRGLLTVTAAAVCAAYVVQDEVLRTAALRTIRLSLWVSAGFSLAAVLGLVDVGGRAEDAGLYLDGQESASGATRLLTDSTHVSLAVLCVALSAAIIRRERLIKLLPYVAPALVVTIFSFSRNALLALALAALVSVVIAGRRGVAGGVRTAVGLTLLGAMVASVLALLGGQVWNFAETQWRGYSERVVSGVSTDVRGRDASTLQRLAENEATTASIAESPILGHGFGFAYRPAFGPSGTFAGDEGRYYSHNFYYWLCVKTGLVGLFVFGWVALRPALMGLRRAHAPVAVGMLALLAVNVVAPLPLSTESSGSVTIGALIGLCLALAGTGAVSARTAIESAEGQPDPRRSPAQPDARSSAESTASRR